MSPPARGAWIATATYPAPPQAERQRKVASREGGVDRNRCSSKTRLIIGGSVASREGGVDRNTFARDAFR